MPLHKVLDHFRTDPGVAIQVDPQAADVLQTRITFKSPGDEFGYVLAAILDQAKLSHCVHSVWLVVGTPDEIRQRGYDVPNSFSQLIAQLKAVDDSIRWDAVLRGNVEPADIAMLPRVRKLLEHSDSIVQRETLRVLTRFGDRALSAQSAALKLTASKDRAVRRVAWRAFATTGSDALETLPTIVKAWDDGDVAVRDDIFDLLRLSTRLGGETERAYVHGSAAFRQFLMRHIGDPDDGQHALLRLGLTDRDPTTRAAALKHGLLFTRYSAAIVEQVTFLQRDDDPLCRVLAAGHLLKLPKSFESATSRLVDESSAETVNAEVRQEALRAFESLNVEMGQRASQMLIDILQRSTSEKTKQFCREAITTITRRQMQIQQGRAEKLLGLHGEILGVKLDRKLVEISVGSDDGVKLQMKFQVREWQSTENRLQPPAVKATIEIIYVTADRSVGRIVDVLKNGDPAKGDVVLLDKTAPRGERGEIRWVAPENGKVWINLGEADDIQRGMRFQVREKETQDNRNQPPVVKGKIEVIRIIDRNTAEARILQEDQANGKIAKGDPILRLHEATEPDNATPKKKPPEGEIYDAARPLGGLPNPKPIFGELSYPISGARRLKGAANQN